MKHILCKLIFQRENTTRPGFLWAYTKDPEPKRSKWSGVFHNLCESEAMQIGKDYAEILDSEVKFRKQIDSHKDDPHAYKHMKPVLQSLINTFEPIMSNPNHSVNLATHQMAGVTFMNTLRVLEKAAPMVPDDSRADGWNAHEIEAHKNLWVPPHAQPGIRSMAEDIKFKKDEAKRIKAGEKKSFARGGKKSSKVSGDAPGTDPPAKGKDQTAEGTDPPTQGTAPTAPE